MEIHAKCCFDFESVKALTHLSMYRKVNPHKCFMLIVIFFGLSLLMALFLIHSRVLSIVSCAIFILGCFLHFVYPRIQFRALNKLQYMENEYTFFDDHISVSSKGEEYNGTAELKYSLIPKVVESSRYFFIYQSKNAVFIVDKATITGGSVEDIRDKLIGFVGKKYMICNY